MMSPTQILALALANRIGHTVYEDSIEVDTTEYDKHGVCTMVGELNDNDNMRKFEFSFFFNMFKLEYEHVVLTMLDEVQPEQPKYDFMHVVEHVEINSARPFHTTINLGELSITNFSVEDINKLQSKIQSKLGVEPIRLGITIL